MGAKDQGADSQATQQRWQVVPRTLCFVTHGEDILLMKRGPHKRIFPGYYNGLGGHLERDEDPLTGAIREIKEESGLTVKNVQFCGSTHVDAGQDTGILLYIFKAEATTREVIESDEGTLHWLSLAEVLSRDDLLLVEDLPIVLPMIFRDGAIPFFAFVSYDENDQILFRVAPSI
ncbi:MAG: NUDIX domain-containing protein [Anaerolineales bacterium]|nr:NUDIX domain-containing protein [Anaerolineales bacterium]